MPNVQTEQIKVAAGDYYTIPFGGNFFHVLDASGPMQIEPDNGLPKIPKARGGSKKSFGAQSFTRLRIKNLNTTQALHATITVGDGDGSDSADFQQQLSSTTNDGVPNFNLADGDDVEISGVDENGNRRKHFTITLRPGLGTGSVPQGYILVYNNRTDRLIGIVGAASSGGGFREETDDDIRIVNKIGAAIQNTGAVPDIAISQVFYKNSV